MNEQDKYLNSEQAARYLKRSRQFIWRERKAGKIAYIRSGKSCLFRVEDLDAYMRRQLVNVEAAASE